MVKLLNLKGHQRKYLRGLAHTIKPIILIGQKGASRSVADALDEALTKHELVKVKFIENKEKESKRDAANRLERATGACLVGHIGHTVIYFRPHPEPEKRKISLPASGASHPTSEN